MSHVTCQVSGVTCHLSGVRCHIFFFLQSDGASRWRVCYQRGRPRLVLVVKHVNNVDCKIKIFLSNWMFVTPLEIQLPSCITKYLDTFCETFVKERNFGNIFHFSLHSLHLHRLKSFKVIWKTFTDGGISFSKFL